MFKIFSSAVLMLFSLGVYAQTTLSGRILSADDHQPLFNATIAVLKAGAGTLVTGTMSNDQGRFTVMNLTPGEYDVNISFIGYQSIKRQILSGTLNKTLDMGNIFLEPSSQDLGEVSVTGQKQAVSATLEKKSYSAADLLSGSTGSVLDMMKILPGVTIDQESRILLRGSDKVAVLIDGKPSSLTGFGDQKGLENIPASQIESIEIINNPSSRYDAAGMAGIVNIKFRQTKKTGFTGDAGLTPGIGMLTKRRADLPTGMPSYSDNLKITPSLNLNYKTEKVNIFWQSYFIRQKRLPNNEFTTRFYDKGDLTESQVAENRHQNHYNLKLGLDWNPSPNQTFTLFGLYDYEWHIDTTRVWFFGNRNYNQPLRKWSFRESEGTGFTNVTFQHKYRFQQTGHELNSQFLFTKGWEDETYYLRQNGPEPYPVINTDKTHVIAPEYVWLFASDYIRPLPFGRFETGFQGRFRHMPITYLMSRNPQNTALIYDFGDWSQWDEDLAGAYLNLVSEFEKLDIEAGLRGEFTSIRYKFAPNDYFKEDQYSYLSLFPNIRITLKANSSNRISVFYNRRIDRPGEDILRIFPKYDDPELLKIGNPSLRPQFTQNMEIAHKYMWKKGSFYTSVYHKITDAYYTRIYIRDPLHSEITIKAYDNLGEATNTGMEISFEQKINSIWNLSASANGYRNIIYSHTGKILFPVSQNYSIPKRTDTPLYAKMTHQLIFPGNLRIDITGAFFSARNIGQGRELARGGLDIGLKKTFPGGKMELNLSATDVFNTMGIHQEIEGEGFTAEYQNYYETQIVSFGIKYKF
ncbi:MAG TPA: TonB-dependent receptor [Prolixibacteraceae bacterium]|nr:TonB-dependent receptor [Prolixibacteraceae bacterium]